MKSLLHYGCYLFYQLTWVLVLNHYFGLSAAGLFFSMIAISTPIFNYLQMGAKQYSLGKKKYMLYDFLKFKLFLLLFLLVLSLILISVASLFFKFNLMLYALVFLYVWSLRFYEAVVDVLLSLFMSGNNFFCLLVANCLIILSIVFVAVLMRTYDFSFSFFLLLSAATLTCCSLFVLVNASKLFGKMNRSFGRVKFKRYLRKFSLAGVGAFLIGLNASLPRYLVEYLGSQELLGVFGNLLYSYVLGLVFVSALAANVYSDDSKIKTGHAYLLLIIMFLVGFFVVLFVGDFIIALAFGENMARYANWLPYFYFPLCLSLLGAFFDYTIIRRCGGKAFFHINLVVLGFSLVLFAMLFGLHVSAIVGGLIMVSVSAIIKMSAQQYFIYRLRSEGRR